jgi:uncharacterized membrane protein
MKRMMKMLIMGALIGTLLFATLYAQPASVVKAEGPRKISSREASFNVYVSDQNKTEIVNETTYVAFFSISIQNSGDALGDVTMSMYGFPNANWDWQPNPGGEDRKIESVWPNEVKWVSIVLYAPLGERAGEYNLYLQVKPGGPTAEISLKAMIPQKGGIEIVAPANIAKEPGVVVELPFQIHNVGNGDDTFTISEIDISKTDWDVSVTIDGKAAFKVPSPKIKPGATKIALVKVTVPYEADATAEGKLGVRVSITAHSNFDKNKEDARGCYIKVLQFWRVIFNVDKVNVTTKPNERVEFTLVIKNDGNGQDNITIKMEYSMTDWSIGLTQSYFNLSKGTGRTATLSIIPSIRALKGDYWITLTATSQGPPDIPDEIQRTVLISVAEVFNINMVIAQNTSAPMPPGGVAEYEFQVINNGNTNDYVKLTVAGAPDGWFITLDNEGVPLGPGQRKTVTLTVLASPRLEESPAQAYFFSVKGISDGQPDLIQYVNVSCAVTSVGRINLEVNGDDTLTVNPYEKENYNFIFDAFNKGNSEDEISLSVSSVSWDQQTVHINPVFYPTLLNIPKYQTRQARMEVTIPRGTALGYYDITIYGVSKLNPASSKTMVVHVKVIQQDLTMQPLRFKKGSEQTFKAWKQYKAEEASTIYLEVPISNNGSEIAHTINMRLYQDGRIIREDNITSIGLLKTVVLRVPWTASFIGTFKIKAVSTIKGDSNIADNSAEAEIKVVEKTTTGPVVGNSNIYSLAPGTPFFWLLVLMVVVGILATTRYMLNLRSEQHTRDLYESIYGDDIVGGQPSEQGKPGGGEGGSSDYEKVDQGK